MVPFTIIDTILRVPRAVVLGDGVIRGRKANTIIKISLAGVPHDHVVVRGTCEDYTIIYILRACISRDVIIT
ncbi:MAG: hypothetical protein RBG13Loki_3745 [Promethearchaeota archaeon CR_4]|nr:MAG: hypothetical protein RBG13Loki_3745 [Candidatus Lokiarchaeota archaeon CR_4]